MSGRSFYDTSGKTFSERTTDPPREAVARLLYQKIWALLNEPAPKPRYEEHLRRPLADFDEERFVPTEGVGSGSVCPTSRLDTKGGGAL